MHNSHCAISSANHSTIWIALVIPAASITVTQEFVFYLALSFCLGTSTNIKNESGPEKPMKQNKQINKINK